MKTLVISLLLVATLCGCREELIQNIDEARAHRVITELYSLGMNAEKVRQSDGGWTVEVQRGDLTKAIAVLSNRKLMPEAMMEDHKPGLMDSKEAHQYAYQRKLSTSLERTLETFPHVLHARVHLYIPPAHDPFAAFNQSELTEEKNSKASPGSASILLLTDESGEVTEEQIEAIVAGASGVPKEEIAVIFERVPPAVIKPASISENRTNEGTAPIVVSSTTNMPLAIDGPTESTNSRNTMLWGTTLYLIGVVILIVGAAVILFKRNSAVTTGQRILYE